MERGALVGRSGMPISRASFSAKSPKLTGFGTKGNSRSRQLIVRVRD
jgi:hypothetical protein